MSAGPVRVKICGITRPEDAAAAAEAGADAVGLVLWSGSPRSVDLETGRRIVAALPTLVVRVGVFVDASRDEMARAADALGLDLLQLHGSEPPEAMPGLPRRAVKALRVGTGFRPEDVRPYAAQGVGILLDAAVEGGLPGGNARPLDWSVARSVRSLVSRLVLAGGLTPETVGRAVASVAPDAVDVSSGVESSRGRKDPARVRAFVAAVRAARAEAS